MRFHDPFLPYERRMLRETFRLTSAVASANYSAGFVWATKMYLGIFAPPFTRESLTHHFGFPVPPPFVTFLNALCQDSATGEAVHQRVADVWRRPMPIAFSRATSRPICRYRHLSSMC
jgi:hypothetical protein